jgi:hypothetical protein
MSGTADILVGRKTLRHVLVDETNVSVADKIGVTSLSVQTHVAVEALA